MKPIVSVIVPAYNAEKTIEKCLDSLLNQTLKNIEIIVINDCSKDNTLKILKKYKNKIKLLDNKKNLGPAGSRNRGLDAATGDYIGFVDSDDWVALNMFELMSSKMDDEVDLVACSRINVSKNGEKKIINTNKDTDAKAFTKTSNYNCDKLFKRSIIEKHKLRMPEQYSYAEDFAFGIRYKYYANKMCILEEPLYYYLADSEGSITNSYKRNLLNIINVLEDMNTFFKENNAFEKYEKELVELSAGFYVRRTREFKNFNDKKLQREFVKKFLNYFKRNFKHYVHAINGFKTKYYRFYRSSYLLMLIYIELQQLRRTR
jgi:glycosyltransferase involved in cell wall biosynthesis